MASKSIPPSHSPRIERRTLSGACAALLLSLLTLALPYFAAATDKNKKTSAEELSLKSLPPTDLTEDQAIAHALNRLGYGPRPGDVDRVKQMGLSKWIDRQLHPESIDDSALNTRLQNFSTLTMSSGKLMEEFPQPKVAAKREGVSVEEYRKEQQEAKQQQQQNIQDQQAMDLVTAVAQAQGDDAATQAKMSSQEDHGDDADTSAPAGKNGKNDKGAKGSGLLPNRLMDFKENHTPQRVVAELSMAKLDRAIYSERQLEAEMTDFWFNHFNVFAGKGLDRWMLTSYERDAIQPHAMGKFRDLLEATAKSPAMLFYLDNWQSVDPEAWARLQQEQAERQAYRGRFGGPFGVPLPSAGANQTKNKKQERGLNENYGRELMELHTLGVDGGYTQDDVIAVARCFTGWSIRTPQRDPQFYFEARLHDNKPKMVLGHKISAGGMKDGDDVLDLLARDPHTAHHLSLEIARHFVSDNPPEALVSRMEQTYLATDGDIRAVLHTMIYSPEFWSQETYRAKVKTPFELVASAARAVNADVQVPFLLVQWTSRIGEPLYQCQPPTGYSDEAGAWVNTGALLNRLNYSLALASGRLAGVRVDVATVLGTTDSAQPEEKPEKVPEETLDRAIAVLLSGEASSQTRDTLAKQMHDPQVVRASLDDTITRVNDGVVAGLVLGAPEFQRR